MKVAAPATAPVIARPPESFARPIQASQRLLGLGMLVIAALFMLLVIAFGRARDSLLVMINLHWRSSAASRACSFRAVCSTWRR